MSHLIDTNIAIHIRDQDSWVVDRLNAFARMPAISIMSLVELEAGVFRNPDLSDVRRRLLDAMLLRLSVLDIDRPIIEAYGRIVAAQGFARSRVIDRLIAATAIVNGMTLVTINADDFRGIAGLDLLIWTAPAQ